MDVGGISFLVLFALLVGGGPALIARLTLSLDELHLALANPQLVAPPAAPAAPQERSHKLGTHAIGNGRIVRYGRVGYLMTATFLEAIDDERYQQSFAGREQPVGVS